MVCDPHPIKLFPVLSVAIWFPAAHNQALEATLEIAAARARMSKRQRQNLRKRMRPQAPRLETVDEDFENSPWQRRALDGCRPCF